MPSKNFRGEIWTNVDPRVMEAMMLANAEPIDGCVGADSHSIRAIELVQKSFSNKIYATFTINGTGANMIALKAMFDRYSSVICAKETHINVYEAGAFEYTLGCKILAADSEDGKLTPSAIEALLAKNKKYKYNPKVVVITQPTELGTLYTVDELKTLCDYVHSLGMYVYVDGARIGNAIAALGTNLTEMIENTGIDAFSLGGTKSGAMFGEMIVFLREEFSPCLAYLQKQSFQHFDKSKFLGVQLERLLEDDLWLENARIGNEKAKVLEKKLREKGVDIFYPVQTNAIFAVLSEEQVDRIATEFDLHYWNIDHKTVRFITTPNTTEADMQRLSELV